MQSVISCREKVSKIGAVGENGQKEAILTNAPSEEPPLSQIEQLAASEKHRKALEDIKLLLPFLHNPVL
jgi:hypothetical protein